MQINNVVAQLVVLRLNGLEVLRQDLVIADLLFKLFDIAFFTLSECSLYKD